MSMEMFEKNFNILNIAKKLEFNSGFEEGYEDSFVKSLKTLAQNKTPPGYKDTMIHNIVKEKKFSAVASELNRQGVKTIPLKGMYLLQTLYRDYPGIREMCDVDILIPREKFKVSKKFLGKRWQLLPSRKNRPLYNYFYHEYGLTVDRDLIEVHRGQSPIDLFQIDYGSFFLNGTVTTNSYKAEFLLPPLEYMAIFSMVHDFSNGFSAAKHLGYRHLTEIYFMIYFAGIEKVRNLSIKFGVEHLLNLYLFLIFSVVQEPFFSSSEFEVKALYSFITKGTDGRPFRFEAGEYLFKSSVFREYILHKTAPKILTFPFDFLYSLGTKLREPQ